MAFPYSLVNLASTRASQGTDKLSSPDHLVHHETEDALAQAIQALIGADGTLLTSALRYQLALIGSPYHALPTGGAQNIWGLKSFLDRIYIPSRYGLIQAATEAATTTFNIRTSNFHKITLTASRIFAVTDVNVGQTFAVRVQQGGTGSYTVTWFSGITWLTSAGTAPTLQTAVGKVDLIVFVCTGAGTYDGCPAAAGG